MGFRTAVRQGPGSPAAWVTTGYCIASRMSSTVGAVVMTGGAAADVAVHGSRRLPGRTAGPSPEPDDRTTISPGVPSHAFGEYAAVPEPTIYLRLMWENAAWGALGGAVYVGIWFLQGFRKFKGWPWTAPGGSAYFYAIVVGIQLGTSATAAVLLSASIPGVPAVVAVIVGLATPGIIKEVASTVSDREADLIRETVDAQVTPRTPITINIGDNSEASMSGLIPDAEAMRVSDSMEKQETLLREMYYHGLAQARNSFRISLTFAVIGAVVLLGGVTLAIWHAPSNGDRYASIVATTAGIVINLTSSLFFVQSNRARRNMGEQATQLREESRDDRRLSAARELAAAITDEKLRNDVRAQLALLLLTGSPSKAPSKGDNETDRSEAANERADQPDNSV